MTHEAELVTLHGNDTDALPSSAGISRLRASNWTGSVLLTSAVLLTTIGVALSLKPNWLVWLLGQVLLALTFVQWFALLHECGHGDHGAWAEPVPAERQHRAPHPPSLAVARRIFPDWILQKRLDPSRIRHMIH